MTIQDLSRDQLVELKGKYLDDKLYEEENRSASYGELAEADEIVSDEEIIEAYGGYCFSDDDFCCSLNKEDNVKDDDNGIWVATMDSESYEWLAVGRTNFEAENNIVKEWNRDVCCRTHMTLRQLQDSYGIYCRFVKFNDCEVM